jgi:hypothetical protein
LHQIKLEAINLARIEYSAHQLANVSPERLQRFFTKLKINIAFVNPCEMFVYLFTQYFERSTIFKMDLVAAMCLFI